MGRRVGTPAANRLLGRHRGIREYNIELDPKALEWKGAVCINVTNDSDSGGLL
jgi:hypothetical protein